MHPSPSTEDHTVMVRRQKGPSNPEIGRGSPHRMPDILSDNVLELQLGARDLRSGSVSMALCKEVSLHDSHMSTSLQKQTGYGVGNQVFVLPQALGNHVS